MIVFDQVTYCYPGAAQPALRQLQLQLAEASFCLLTGRSGTGKSTLLRCVNGLVPHFSGGTLHGRISVNGLDPVLVGPQLMSRQVGFVFQDPEAQFVMDQVEDEIAFGLENAALPRQEMRVRVEEVLDLLDLAHLRTRRLDTLSGGEKQRVAIAAALALRPRVLVLDEPTSQLDPKSAEDVFHALVRLNADLGLTILVAEHRLERVLAFADRLIHLPHDQAPVVEGVPREVLARLEVVPPLIQLARVLGWQPLPLTIKEGLHFSRMPATAQQMSPAPVRRAVSGRPLVQMQGVSVRYGAQMALRGVDLDLHAQQISVLMGRNGSGKTTLLKTIVGLLRPATGRVQVLGQDIAHQDVAHICRQVGYLPQDPNALLFADTVADELRITLRNHGLSTERQTPEADRVYPPAELLEQLGIARHAGRYPRDLSAGERQRVALAAVTVTRPDVLLLDEPTRGLDYAAKHSLAQLLRSWRDAGKAILVVTHDVEFAAMIADQVILLSQGEIIACGAPDEVLGSSPLFAPQVARLFPGRGWLTAEDALHNLHSAGCEIKEGM